MSRRRAQPRTRLRARTGARTTGSRHPCGSSWAAARRRRAGRLPRGVAADLEAALDILDRVQPDFAEVMRRDDLAGRRSRRRRPQPLAAPGGRTARSSSTSRTGPGRSTTSRTCCTSAATWPSGDDAAAGHRAVGAPDHLPDGSDEGASSGTAYVVLHAVVTERWMVRGLPGLPGREPLSDLERIEARGRLAYILGRFVPRPHRPRPGADVVAPRDRPAPAAAGRPAHPALGSPSRSSRARDLTGSRTPLDLDTFIVPQPAAAGG